MHSSCLINQLNTVNTKYILKIFQGQSLMPGFRKHADISKKIYPVDTGRKLNVHKTFGRRPGRLLNVLCTFNLRPLSTGWFIRKMNSDQKFLFSCANFTDLTCLKKMEKNARVKVYNCKYKSLIFEMEQRYSEYLLLQHTV